MKRFYSLTAIGAAGAFATVFGCGFLSDKLVAAWKFERAGQAAMTVGTALGRISWALTLPARVFSLGSNSTVWEIIGLAIAFIFWGALFALIVERVKQTSA